MIDQKRSPSSVSFSSPSVFFAARFELPAVRTPASGASGVSSVSILAEPSVAVVDEVVDRKGTRKLAEAYINYLYSPQGQEIAAQNFYRPRNPDIAAKYSAQFPALKLVTIDDAFGGWAKAQKKHFADGGSFDQIYEKK